VDITRRELISTIAKTGVPAAVAVSIGAPSLHAETENIRSPARGRTALRTPAFASVAKPASRPAPKPTIRRPIRAGTRCIRRPTTSTISPATYQALQTGGWLACLFREAAVHALSRSRLRGWVSVPGAAQRSRDGHRELDRRGMHRLRYCTITCPYHVPRFQCRVTTAGDQVRVVGSTRLEKGLRPGCTNVCPQAP